MQRGAQLMRHIRGQVAALLIGGCQLLGHAIELNGQSGKFTGAAHGHPYAQVAVRDRVGRGHHVGQRHGDPPERPDGQRNRQKRQCQG